MSRSNTVCRIRQPCSRATAEQNGYCQKVDYRIPAILMHVSCMCMHSSSIVLFRRPDPWRLICLNHPCHYRCGYPDSSTTAHSPVNPGLAIVCDAREETGEQGARRSCCAGATRPNRHLACETGILPGSRARHALERALSLGAPLLQDDTARELTPLNTIHRQLPMPLRRSCALSHMEPTSLPTEQQDRA